MVINGPIFHAEKRWMMVMMMRRKRRRNNPIPPYAYPIAKKGLTLRLENFAINNLQLSANRLLEFHLIEGLKTTWGRTGPFQAVL